MQARQHDGDSGSDSDSDSDSDSRSCRRGVCTITSCTNRVCQTVISTRGGVAQTLGPAGPTSGSAGAVSTPTPIPTPNTTATRSRSNSTTRTLSVHPSSTSGLGTQGSNGLSKSALAGIIVAIFIVTGLLAMWLTRVRNRRRRKEKRPQGFSSSAFLTGTGVTARNNHDDNDMAQVESGSRSPVVGLTRMNGNVGGISYRNDSASPLSPPPPAVTQGYEGRMSPNPGQISIRSASRAGDGASVLTSPYSETSCAEIPLPAFPREVAMPSSSSAAAASATAWNGTVRSVGNANPPPTGAGTLYSDMHSFQKQLEADNEKQSASGRLWQDPVVDIPPSYSSSSTR